jgi:autotransporter-associated beta strand protein
VQNLATIINGGTLATDVNLQNFGALTNTGTIVGATQNFNTLDNIGTMGSLQSLGGTATNSGTINGNVQNFAAFTSTAIVNGDLANFGTAQVQGEINGELKNVASGATVTLTGTTTGITKYTGADGATLDLASFWTTVGGMDGGGSIVLGTATLTVDRGDPVAASFNGGISGDGAFIKTGTGWQWLGGVNTYTGLTTVSGGTLEIGPLGSLAGDVQNDANFLNSGTVAGVLTNTGAADNSGMIAGGVTNLGAGATFTTNGTVGHRADQRRHRLRERQRSTGRSTTTARSR